MNRYFTVNSDVMASNELTPMEKFVYSCLCYFKNYESGQCFPSYDTLATLTGLCRRVVIKIIKILEEKGFIIKEARIGKNNENLSNLYTLPKEIKRIKNGKSSSENIEDNKKLSTASSDKVYDEPTMVNDSNDLVNSSAYPSELRAPSLVNEDTYPSASGAPEQHDINNNKNNITIYNNNNNNNNNNSKKEEDVVVDYECVNELKDYIKELSENSIKTLLKVAKNNIEKIKEKYEIAKGQNVRNLVGFLISALKNDYESPIKLEPEKEDKKEPEKENKSYYQKPVQKKRFNSWESEGCMVQYDFEKLKELERRHLDELLAED